MANRLNRNGVQSVCGSLKTFPGTFGGGPYFYDTYNYTNPTGVSQCVTVTLTTGGTGNVFSTAYLGSFTPANLATNYLADPGLSTGTPPTLTSFSFDLASGATVVLVVNETNANEVCAAYTLTVDVAPAQFNVTGGGTYCNGTGGLPVGLSGSESGRNYQLELNGNPVGSTVPRHGWSNNIWKPDCIWYLYC